MTGLVPWSPRERVTVWLDPRTARGVDDAGRTVRPVIGGRRKLPALADLLDTVRSAGAARGFLVGPRPAPGWLLVAVPGWTAGAHYLDASLPVARFTHDATGAAVELRRSAEWFGDALDQPGDALMAWELLAHHYGRAFGGARLFDSPAATGMDAWVRSLPRGAEAPPQLDGDTAALVRATSPQHRVELFTHAARKAPGFYYLDGRLQYASLTRELGTGPARRLTADAAHDLAYGDPYARARYRVTATVPAGWDTLGLLMAPAGPNPRDGWHAPREPRQTFTTWADAAELRLAHGMGWPVEIHEAIAFGKGRPLDTWTARLLRVRDAVSATDAPEHVRDAVRGALRNVLLYTIGAFHSTGRDTTRVVTNPMDWRGDPADLEQRGDVWVARQRVELTGRNLAFRHPEWSSQVWARAHARVLESPTGDRARWAGALQLRFTDLLGVRGDALYLSRDPRWPDDGAVGRLRLKGHLHGPLNAPTTATQLNELRTRAERNGPTCPEC